MTDLPPHKRLEHQIERVHQLLESEESVVTWNDHIPDPDSPSQSRQIDVSIRRDGLLTLVECRLHKEPQDVTWIEELIGRRASLKAAAVIAVSASGFTKTARAKASAHGVHLRDFATLSDGEIRNWGRTRTIRVNFCEFSDVVLTLGVAPLLRPEPLRLTDINGRTVSPITWRLLFQSIMKQLDQQKWPGVSARIDTQVDAKLLVNGHRPASMSLSARVRRISQTIRLASVFEYADPLTATSHAEVGRYELGGSEIIENGDDVAMTIDLSGIVVPDGCCFETVLVDAGRVVTARPYFIGMEHVINYRIPMQIRYVSGSREISNSTF
jgi:hypothetical protein